MKRREFITLLRIGSNSVIRRSRLNVWVARKRTRLDDLYTP
jgi:hypothetical protein